MLPLRSVRSVEIVVSRAKYPAHWFCPASAVVAGLPSKSAAAKYPVMTPPSEWPPHSTLFLRRVGSGNSAVSRSYSSRTVCWMPSLAIQPSWSLPTNPAKVRPPTALPR